MNSYHDVHITTEKIPRASIFNLPYGLAVHCTRVSGWQLWDMSDGIHNAKLLAAEYEDLRKWLVIDVDGHVIIDSRKYDPITLAGPGPDGSIPTGQSQAA